MTHGMLQKCARSNTPAYISMCEPVGLLSEQRFGLLDPLLQTNLSKATHSITAHTTKSTKYQQYEPDYYYCKLLNEVGRARLITPYQSKESPAPQYQPIDRKRKIVEYCRERATLANKKLMALLLKPVSPKPSNTGSQDCPKGTQRGINVLRYREVL